MRRMGSAEGAQHVKFRARCRLLRASGDGELPRAMTGRCEHRRPQVLRPRAAGAGRHPLRCRCADDLDAYVRMTFVQR